MIRTSANLVFDAPKGFRMEKEEEEEEEKVNISLNASIKEINHNIKKRSEFVFTVSQLGGYVADDAVLFCGVTDRLWPIAASVIELERNLDSRHAVGQFPVRVENITPHRSAFVDLVESVHADNIQPFAELLFDGLSLWDEDDTRRMKHLLFIRPRRN